MQRAEVLVATLLLAGIPATGCIGNRVIYPVMPTPEQLAEFEAAGPDETLAASDGLAAMSVSGPYRVVPGDLLTIRLPSEVEGTVGEDEPSTLEIESRVARDGTVRLPMIGNFAVQGMTTGEAEDALATAYTQGILKDAPNVVVTVEEYKTISVAVIGSVNSPGIHELRTDRRTVLGALTAAGGIKSDRGARSIRVVRAGEGGAAEGELFPVRSDAIPLQDVALDGGETIVVEPQPERSFCVYGLVGRSGVFPYPEPRRYNLLQALATAGGVDSTAAPRYATIYRKKDGDTVLATTFKIDGESLTDGSNILIKDGDVIAVEHTQGTWLRQFFSQVFGFRASFSVQGASSATL